jgi:hypothetical protein
LKGSDWLFGQSTVGLWTAFFSRSRAEMLISAKPNPLGRECFAIYRPEPRGGDGSISGKERGVEAIVARDGVSERSARMGFSLAFLPQPSSGRLSTAASPWCFAPCGHAVDTGGSLSKSRSAADSRGERTRLVRASDQPRLHTRR